jgi:hypothetical protein
VNKGTHESTRVGVVTVRQFESGAAQPRNATEEVISSVPSKSAGVEFIAENGEGPGVRLRKQVCKVGLVDSPASAAGGTRKYILTRKYIFEARQARDAERADHGQDGKAESGYLDG